MRFWQFLVVRYGRDRKSGGGVDFVAGFMLGGVVIGTLGYLLAPQVIKQVSIMVYQGSKTFMFYCLNHIFLFF